jgi:hypothetical protein
MLFKRMNEGLRKYGGEEPLDSAGRITRSACNGFHTHGRREKAGPNERLRSDYFRNE